MAMGLGFALRRDPVWLSNSRQSEECVMSESKYDRGLEIRRAVVGEDYVNQALANADEF